MIFVCPQGLRWRKVHGTMQASSPTQHGSRLCRILQDTPRAKRQCTPQSASPPAPLAGEPLGRLPPRKASPARGGGCAAGADGGVRRLAPQISFRVAGGGRTPPRPCAGGADDFRLPARFALAQGPRDDASIVPYAARIEALPDFAGHSLRKAAMHPSVGFAASSLAGEPLGRLPPHKASPARGGGCATGADGGVRRLAPQISFRVAGGGRPSAAPQNTAKNPPPAGACLAGGGAVYAFGYGAFFPHGQALTERP